MGENLRSKVGQFPVLESSDWHLSGNAFLLQDENSCRTHTLQLGKDGMKLMTFGRYLTRVDVTGSLF